MSQFTFDASSSSRSSNLLPPEADPSSGRNARCSQQATASGRGRASSQQALADTKRKRTMVVAENSKKKKKETMEMLDEKVAGKCKNKRAVSRHAAIRLSSEEKKDRKTPKVTLRLAPKIIEKSPLSAISQCTLCQMKEANVSKDKMKIPASVESCNKLHFRPIFHLTFDI